MRNLILPLFLGAGLLLASGAAWAHSGHHHVEEVEAKPGPDVFAEYSFEAAHGLRYVVYTPKAALEPGEARFPLVLYLHGSCAECITHARILKESNLQVWHGYGRNEQLEPTFLIAPAGGRGGWGAQGDRKQSLLNILDDFIEAHPVDPDRIYLTGFSMGGYGVWGLLHERPEFFAAANPQGTGRREVDAELLKEVPIWATIGADDRPEWVEGMRQAVASIRAANGDGRGALPEVMDVNPRLSIFEGVNHGAAQTATQQMEGYLEWFYAQSLARRRGE